MMGRRGTRASKPLTSRTKRVASSKLPHAREQLSKAANEEGHADDDVWRHDAGGLRIHKREDQRGRREGEQATVFSIRMCTRESGPCHTKVKHPTHARGSPFAILTGQIGKMDGRRTGVKRMRQCPRRVYASVSISVHVRIGSLISAIGWGDDE